jgi:hypothetical protein
MSPLARKQLGKLDLYQSKLRELDENYLEALSLKTVCKWVAIAGTMIVLVKLVPHVSYQQIGLSLSGLAGGAAVLAMLIWLEQRAKTTRLMREMWAVSESAKADGVRLSASGRIDRDDVGEPINPFPLIREG